MDSENGFTLENDNVGTLLNYLCLFLYNINIYKPLFGLDKFVTVKPSFYRTPSQFIKGINIFSLFVQSELLVLFTIT